MPAVGSAIAAFAATTAGSFLLSTVAPIALSVGLNILQQNLLTPRQVTGVEGTLRGGGVVPRSFIHGRWATAGSLVYGGTRGAASKTPNAWLVQVISLSDLPSRGLVGLRVDGQEVTYDPEAEEEENVGIPIPEYFRDGDNHLWVKFYDGTQTDADPWLVEQFGADPVRPWTEDHVGVGITYAVITARLDEELFSGYPRFLFIVDGFEFYDVREDDTAGGDGDQLFADPSSWGGADENPMAVAYGILRGITFNGEWFYGLQATAAGRLPFSAWAAALNECDALVPKEGGTEKQFLCGGEIQVNQPPADTLEEILASCSGRLAEVGGIYKPHVGAAGAAVFSFDDGALLTTQAQELDPFRSLAETVNAVAARYISPGDGWDFKDAPPRLNPELEDEDGGRRWTASIDYGRVSSPTQVQRLMTAALKEARRERKHMLVLPPDANVLEPNDFTAWSSDRNGYDAKLFRVDAVRHLANLDVAIDITEVDPADYDWEPEDDEAPTEDGPTEIVRPTAQGIVGFAAVGVSIAAAGGTIPAAQLTWATDVDDVDGIIYEIRRASDQVVVLADSTDDWRAGVLITAKNLVRASNYQAHAKYRPHSDRPTSFGSWESFTTPAVAPWDGDVSAINAAADQHIANTWATVDERRREQTELREQLGLDNAVGTGDALIQREQIRKKIELAVNAPVGGLRAAVTIESEARASQDGVLAATITAVEVSLQGQINANAAIIVSHASRITATENSIIVQTGQIVTLQADLDLAEAAGALNASGLAALDARVTSAEGVNTSQGTAITALQSDMTAAEGDIAANASAISTLNTTVTSHGTSISSLSSSMTSVQASVGNLNAAGLIEIVAAASQSGVSSRIAIRTRATTGGSFAEAGIYIETTTGGVKRVVVLASQFLVSDTVNGVNITPLSIVSGKVRFTANVEIDGNLTIAGTISTPKVANNAITETGFSNNDNEAWVDEDVGDELILAPVTVVVSSTSQVFVFMTAWFEGRMQNIESPASRNCGIYRDTTLLVDNGSGPGNYAGNTYPEFEKLTDFYTEVVSPGTYTYSFRCGTSGFGGDLTVSIGVLVCKK